MRLRKRQWDRVLLVLLSLLAAVWSAKDADYYKVMDVFSVTIARRASARELSHMIPCTLS